MFGLTSETWVSLAGLLAVLSVPTWCLLSAICCKLSKISKQIKK